MQELIKEIEAAQIKEVTDFNVGDTIKVHAKIVEGNREFRFLKVLLLRNRVEATEQHLL